MMEYCNYLVSLVRVMLVVIILVTISSSSLCKATSTSLAPKFPALMAFGDSTMDTGNNNFIGYSLLRSDHPPYGVSFPGAVPTGRFSDGKLIPDFLAASLGIKDTLPPFLDPTLTKEDLATGVCFASAGAGFDEVTNREAGVIPVMKQLDMFRRYIEKLTGLVGEEEAQRIVGEALYLISAGTNDFAVSYYDIQRKRKQFDNIAGYQDFILTRLRDFVQELQKLGARKMAVLGLGPTGCLPIQVAAAASFMNNNNNNNRNGSSSSSDDDDCIQEQNLDSQAYNLKLVRLLSSLQAAAGATTVIHYGNLYDPFLDMITHPLNYGLKETKKGCCGMTGMVETAYLCNHMSPICPSASDYLFWDCIHPSHPAYASLSHHLLQHLPT